MWSDIARGIEAATGRHYAISERVPVAGGCINRACRVTDGERMYFVKTNAAAALDMYAAEAAGLAAIGATRTVRVPQPICTGSNADAAWLVLEYVALGPLSEVAAAPLARLHAHSADRYGWHRDNTIGRTPQHNAWCADWPTFWRERRLEPQLALAQRNGYGGRLQRDGARLCEHLPAFFGDYRPAPALLHGDLWGGNAGSDDTGAPVVFDPATYYGDREADLAMTELFDGYPPAFYAAYEAASPLDAGYRVRKTLYNLYHVLNHLNLFGTSYIAQAKRMMARLLAEIH